MSATQIVALASTSGSGEGLSPTDMRLIAAHEAAARGDGILAPYDPALLASLPRSAETIVTVLDIADTARALEQGGIPRYGLSRARSLGPVTMTRLIPAGLRLAPQVPRSGISGVGLMLVAAELRHAADLGIRSAALHWQLSDFLVANGATGWLAGFIGQARRYGLQVGLCANDVGRVLGLAGELRGLDFVIAPLSAAGFRMTPDQPACEDLIRNRSIEVIPHLGSLDALSPDDLVYARGLGLARYVVDA